MSLALTRRIVKGSPLTPAEMDQNLADIETEVNALAAAIGVSLNADGSLKESVYTETEVDNLLTALEATIAIGTMGQRDVHISTSAPTSGDGADGDIWIRYVP